MSRTHLHHAGILARGGAFIIDGIMLFLLAFALLLPLIAFGMTPTTEAGLEGFGVLLGLGLSAVYHIGSEAAWAQTPGKMALDLKVVYLDGSECDGEGAVLRNITKIIGNGSLAVVVAILLIALSEENQRLGDMIGQTTVVKDGGGNSTPSQSGHTTNSPRAGNW